MFTDQILMLLRQYSQLFMLFSKRFFLVIDLNCQFVVAGVLFENF